VGYTTLARININPSVPLEPPFRRESMSYTFAGTARKGFWANSRRPSARFPEAGLFLAVTPDFDEIERSLWRKTKRTLAWVWLFQIRQVSLQLIFRDSFAAVELFDAAPVFPLIIFQFSKSQRSCSSWVSSKRSKTSSTLPEPVA
jgi:hypothetical protein